MDKDDIHNKFDWFDRLKPKWFGKLMLRIHSCLSEKIGWILSIGVILSLLLVGVYVINTSETTENSTQKFIHGIFVAGNAWDQGGYMMPFVGFIGAIIFSGIFISTCSNFVRGKIECFRKGEISYHLYDHVVIIGFDEVVPSIVQRIINSKEYKGSKIIISSRQDITQVREKVYNKLGKSLSRVVFIHSIRHSKESLSRLHTVDAKELFVIGDRTQNDHDSENMHIMQVLYEIHKDAIRIPVFMWFEQEASFFAFQLNDIKKEWKKCFEFKPYNFYKDWANRLLVSYNREKGIYPKLDHTGIGQNSNKHIHLVVIGMNRMGIAIAKEVAHLMHFPNFNEKTLENQTVITFIDDNADREMRFFQGRHPGYFEIAPMYYWNSGDGFRENENPFSKDDSLVRPEYKNKNFLDVRFQFICGRIESPAVRDWLKSQVRDCENQYLTVAICLHDPNKALGVGLYLPEELYGTNNGNYTNIFIRQDASSALVESLRKDEAQRFKHVYPFGMIDDSGDIGCRNVIMAQAFNYVYDFYGKHNSLSSLIPSVSELEKLWIELPVSQQWSNIYLADSFEFKLRSIDVDKTFSTSEEQKNIMARVEHSRWNMEKLLMGYRALHQEEWNEAERQGNNRKKYLKDLKDNRFIHSCIVAYDDVDDYTKQLDKNIIETLSTIEKHIIGGLQS